MKKVLIMFFLIIILTGCSSGSNNHSDGIYIENDNGTYDYYKYPDNNYPDPYDNVRNW